MVNQVQKIYRYIDTTAGLIYCWLVPRAFAKLCKAEVPMWYPTRSNSDTRLNGNWITIANESRRSWCASTGFQRIPFHSVPSRGFLEETRALISSAEVRSSSLVSPFSSPFFHRFFMLPPSSHLRFGCWVDSNVVRDPAERKYNVSPISF